MSLINLMDAAGGVKHFSAVFDGSSNFLERTFVAATNRKKFTLSMWVKGSSNGNPILTAFQVSGVSILAFAKVNPNPGTNSPGGPDGLDFFEEAPPGDTDAGFTANDPPTGPNGVNLWNHLMIACDTTQGTELNRIKVYANYAQVSEGGIQADSNYDFVMGLNVLHLLGAHFGLEDDVNYAALDFYEGQIAEVNYVDGLQLTPADFAVNGATIRPKKYTGAFGNQGFYLPFSDANNMGKDFSGNGNDFAVHSGFVAPTRSGLNPWN